MMKQCSVLEFHILSGEASREVLSRGGDQRRVMSSQLWTWDEEVAIAVKHPQSLRARKFRTGPSTEKVMATIFWDQDRILLVDFLSPVSRPTVTGTPNSCGNWRVASGTSDRTLTSRISPFVTTRVFVHPWATTGEKLAKLVWTVIPHPPYSTDLASSNFHLFGLLKDFLRGQYFTNNGGLKTTVSLSSKNVDKELYRAGFQQCARRWEKCVLVNGNWEERWILTVKEAGCGYVSTNANSHFVEQISVNMWY